MGLAVNLVGVFEDRVHALPLAIFQFPVETASAAGVTGHAPFLIYLEQNDVFIAIQPDFANKLLVPGCFAFAPELAP
jgi:hypothetical protein